MSFESLPPFSSVFGVLFSDDTAGWSPRSHSNDQFNSGKWSPKVTQCMVFWQILLSELGRNPCQEVANFNDAVRLYGMKNVTDIQKAVGTRSRPQIRNRIQKVRKKASYIYSY